MTLDAARQWMEQHPEPPPLHPPLQQQLNELLQQEAATDRLIEQLHDDPLTSARLLATVNQRSRKSRIESLTAAASLLGDHALRSWLKEQVAEVFRFEAAHQAFLYAQLLDRSLHNARQATDCARRLGYAELDNLHTAASLMYLGELSCCAHAPDRYLEFCRQGGGDQAARAVFGFDFSELNQQVAERLQLPERVIQGQAHRTDGDAKSQLLRLTGKLCRDCEHGWNDERVHADLQQLAERMQRPIDTVRAHIQATAIDAARNSPFEAAWQPARRLPLIRDGFWTPPAAPAPSPPKAAATTRPARVQPPARGMKTRERLQTLLRQEDCTQSQLLNACLQGLHEDLGFSRISLFLLSRDRKMLHNRLALGLDEQAPIRRYAVDTARAGLLGRLLEKPQAIHINRGNWMKYESLIPPSLLARLDTRDFAAMSVFIGNTAIGVIMVDRKGKGAIKASDFQHFKQVVSLCSKALTLLSKRAQTVPR